MPLTTPNYINVSASTTSNLLSAFTFSNSNNVTFGLNASTITASIPADFSAGMSSAGNTAGTTGLVAGSLNFAGSRGITLSQSVNAQSATLTILGPIQSKMWFNNAIGGSVATNLAVQGTSNGTLYVFPLNYIEDDWGQDMTANTVMFNLSISHTNVTTSTLAKTFSVFLGIYTSVNSTQLSILNSVSVAYTRAATSVQSAELHGARFMTIHSSLWSVQPVFINNSRYIGAFFFRTSGEALAVSMLGQYMHNTDQRSGTIGSSVASNTTMGWGPWQGRLSASTAALPAALARSDIQKNVSNAMFIPNLLFNNEASSF